MQEGAMSRIFNPSDDGWSAAPLEGERAALLSDADHGAVLLQRHTPAYAGGRSGWAVLASDGACLLLNGEPVALGLAVLRHRDELRVGDAGPFYYSDERLAAVEAFASDDAPRCPRCAQPIARGELSVRCPACGVLHHHRADRECWTHVERCALCEQSTDLEAGLRWTPKEL
jgi:hypothetical protein